VADGFLNRWSQRKQMVREGKVPDEPEVPVAETLPATNALLEQQPLVGLPQAEKAAHQPPVQPLEQPPTLSLDDVKSLTSQSDFAPFVARDVAPEVRNAAMKKLFTDPHYNVMDRLDTYIDDYSRPDPLPESMLRQMASAKFLKLFEDDDEVDPGQARPEVPPSGELRDDANTVPGDSVAQSPQLLVQPKLPERDQAIENKPGEAGPNHDHTDMRLQSNHAAGPRESGRSTE
jgi:hypothetical protein